MIPIFKSGPPETTLVDPIRQKWDQHGVLMETVTYSPAISTGSNRWKEGYRVQNFKQRKAAGDLLPHTPYKEFTVEFERTGQWRQQDTRSYGWDTHLDPFIGTAGFLAVSELTKYAPDDLQLQLQAAASRISGKGHDTLTFLAEVRKLRAMFENTLKRLIRLKDQATRRRLLKKFRDYNPRDPDYQLRVVSELWLEGRYGWRTLYYDIVDLDDAIRAFDVKRTRFSERAGVSYSGIETTTALTGSGLSVHQYTRVSSWQVSARGAISADIRPPRFRFNPVETGWELVPYSFLLDWLLDVGSALASLSFLALQTDYTASTGYVITLDYREDRLPFPVVQSHYDWTGTYAYTNSHAVYKERNPQSLSTIPRLTVNLDTWKVFDLLALFLVGAKSTQTRR